MGTRVKSIVNATMMQLPVKLADGTTVFLLPGCRLENVELEDVDSIKGSARIVVDQAPQEQTTQKSRRQRING